jgi:hypothetical protein
MSETRAGDQSGGVGHRTFMEFANRNSSYIFNQVLGAWWQGEAPERTAAAGHRSTASGRGEKRWLRGL